MRPCLEFLLANSSEAGLAPDHHADLRASGLTEETIHRHRLRAVPRGLIGSLLGFDMPCIRSALLIPFPEPAGGFMDHVRVKVFPALTDRGGHSIKYLQPRQSGTRLFFPLAEMPEALNGATPLWLVEGEKKALAVAQLGLPAIGFCGIEGWHPAGSRELLPDFEHIRLIGRVVELVPDGDWQSNASVARGAFRLAQALESRGARVRLVILPPEAG